MGVSADYNKPCNMDQLKRMKEDKLRLIYNSIKCSHNLVDISRVKGADLECIDQDHTYIMTYSFPCQDLSVAGNRKGMADTTTRSGLLWEVERILTEQKELEKQNKGCMCNILLMENVIQVHSEKDMIHFRKWINRLEELGYQNYWQDLIATDYGIPQTRNRCFMISIYGNYSYNFPKPIFLKLRLKDLLEENVDEKYFLSDKMIDYIYSNNYTGPYKRREAREHIDKQIEEKGIAVALTTNNNSRPTDNFIRIKNNNSKGYLEAEDGDGVDISGRMQHHRGTVQKGKSQTLTTGGIGEKDSNNNTQWKLQNCIYSSDNSMPSIATAFNPYVDDPLKESLKELAEIGQEELRIRKLTPKECLRLMNVKDEDIELMSEHQTNALLYHIAGDSICSNVLMALLGQLVDVNWEEKFSEIEKRFLK